ncbi:hydantoinase/oxoprolinase N-terminal domain-containing protein [Neptunicoccus sediminis]|uniref:hydantoinase/oxoprolinase N-terminal domain-containing protein n=1 Tax=Neptunicoccus sediminis TaxID=1892596 RepID=UPI000845EFC4|nr:hydantoinase/oxoprolinase family protein [Neptunicoccus sediminis]
MALLLGVDTGGTYTDAVLIRGEDEVIATAKSLTTRHDLSEGVGKAVQAVLDAAAVAPDQIALSSLSTTLATNALVEGQGARVALVFIGFDEKDIARQGLEDALRGDPVIRINGGHSHSGSEAAPFDQTTLEQVLDGLDGAVTGFAIASQFATRNPAHEIAARDLIRARTGLPVTCSHELSAKLGGPKRAMTAVLNARLIGMIDHLIGATQDYLHRIGVTAPMMVVRGDGALISADMARERPIETILSGPAASIVGARWLTGESDALVSDIGGTTTDVAVLRDRQPMIDPHGARVGGLRTMVEAVAMRTTGLGGDSEVHLQRDGLAGGLRLGPRRVLPLSLAAMQYPDVVPAALERQCTKDRVGEYDGRFVVPVRLSGQVPAGLDARETRLLERIAAQAWEMGSLLSNRLDGSALDRLVARGLVMIAAITPSDAAHVTGVLDSWNKEAAALGLELFSRQRNGAGQRIAPEGAMLAPRIIDQLTQQTCDVLLETAFAEEDTDFGLPEDQLARHVLTRLGTQQHRGLVSLNVGLNLPVIGLGASAHSYYGAVGERLSTPVILPEHAGVANAIGAVVGQVSMRKSGLITSIGERRYRVHFIEGPQDFNDLDRALKALETRLGEDAMAAARESGAQGIRLHLQRDLRNAEVEGRDVFVEAELTATASGRPRIAR